MRQARLSARWQGHALGSIVHGRDADAAVAAGVAEPIEPIKPGRKIRTGASAVSPDPSPTHEDNDRGATDAPEGQQDDEAGGDTPE